MPQAFPVQGISLSTYSVGGYADSRVAELVDRAAANGANNVVFSNVVLADLKTGAIGDVIENGQNQTAPLADVGRAIDLAQAQGLNVVLKPQIVVHDPAFDQYNSASWINLVNPDLKIENPAAFFASYKAHILAWAQLAQDHHVGMLSIGNEMVAATKAEYTPYWNDIIDAVRQVYSGQLTYAALAPVQTNSPVNEITQVGFWNKLDVAGFDVFPSLTHKTDPSVADLAAGWHGAEVFGQVQDYASFLNQMAAHVGKPVIFTETGLPSFNGASDRIATSDGNIGSSTPDQGEQADWWQAFFQTWSVNKPAWLKGVLLINNDPGDLGTYYDQNYNIDGKLAEAVVTSWFGGRTVIAPDAKSLAGGQGNDELYLYDPHAPAAANQAASLTTTVKVQVTGAIAGGDTPVLHAWVNGVDFGQVKLKPVDSGYVDGAGVHFSQTQTFDFELPGLVRIDQLKIGFEGQSGLSTYFHGVSVNGVALAAGAYTPAGGGAFAVSLASGASPWNGGYTLFDASPWNSALAARTTGSPNDPITVTGGGGADVVHVLGSASQYSLQQLADGGVRLSETSGLGQNAILKGVSAVVFGDGARLSLANLGGGSTGGSQPLTGDAGDNVIIGTPGNDVISDPGGYNYLRGGDGDDRITGGAGFDDANGNAGNDTISGGAGQDWVVGGKDNDLLFGDSDFDIVYGNLGNDTVDGGTGADWVRGGQGADVVKGGDGDDWLAGDRGADTISGGSGADIFHLHAASDTDRVLDFNAAEGDRVNLEAGSAYQALQVNGDVVVRLSSGAEMTLVGVSLNSLPSGWLFVG